MLTQVSVLVWKVCESGRETEDLDLQSLATHVTETLVFHIQKRVGERPAGTLRLLLSAELALINCVSAHRQACVTVGGIEVVYSTSEE